MGRKLLPKSKFFKASLFKALQPAIVIVLIFISGNCISQSIFLQPADSLNKSRAWLVGSVATVGTAGAIAGLSQVWYSDYDRGDFRFFNDNDEWLQMDKAGHVFSAYQLTQIGFESFRWAGVRPGSSLIASAAFSLTFMTAIEILDGHSTGWGFSTGDVVANISGTAVFAAQQLVWDEQRFTIKFSYMPSDYAQYRPETLGSSQAERFIKDYNGQTYWLSANVFSLTGKPNGIPPWLNVAFGYGADGMLGGSGNPMMNEAGCALPSFERERQYFISLDIDTRRIQTKSYLLKTIFSVFGFIKIPSPTLEFRGGNVYGHWLYF